MAGMLESPGDDRDAWCLALWRGIGDDVVDIRPFLTGDVFESVNFELPGVGSVTENVIVLTHPCAMRSDGVHLTDRLLVAAVTERSVTAAGWPTDSILQSDAAARPRVPVQIG